MTEKLKLVTIEIVAVAGFDVEMLRHDVERDIETIPGALAMVSMIVQPARVEASGPSE